ncbi:MAG TPA: S8 family serine peptidase [bacterium]|nr:S8 family serine peptidase [bacterium]HMW36477.1 S8 family serine peptidase [bacterium]HMY34893.1 S8 family serine peptidase [bacterium]HMZ04584.1 S8 family serine peptidase [bacterium]HNB09729.1 S8 family serine peptidase [bacterium]
MEGDVWSLDIPGNAGYNNGLYRISSPYCYDKYTSLPPGYEGDGSPYNYMRRFGGTSAACPQVSGVAALILSLNSNFTQSQVQYFIRNSAVDMGTAGWDVDFGFGRLNAHKALVLAGFPIIADPITNIHWCYNSQKKISWTSNLSTSYTVKVSTDGGSTFPTTIASNVTSGSASYSYNWTVNIGPSFTCKLLVIDNNNSALRDTSDLFVIDGTAVPSIPGSFSLTSKGGHPWLTWTTDGSAAGYDLYRASSEYNPPYTWYKFMTINDPTITNYHDVVVDIGITNPNTMKYKINAFNGCNMYSVFTAEKQINYDQFMKNNNANETLIPNEFSLNQNYPNPFNPTTTIEYAVAKTTLVRLTVYDELGREVAILVNEKKMPGIYRVDFDASKFASGVYFYRMTAGEFMETKKLLLVK